MPTISKLGHVGLYCSDLAGQEEFYTHVLGLTKTDEDLQHGLVFLSSQPETEHHELLLVAGRDLTKDSGVLQQISFRCASLTEVIEFYQRFQERGVKLDMVVTHGNAIGVYFFDPEGNRGEVYCSTGLVARQPFLVPVDLDDDPETILTEIAKLVELYGETGVLPDSMREGQRLGTGA